MSLQGVCISFRGDSVCIWCISSERIGVFSIKFCSSDPSFNRNILRSLYLKFKISAHALILITHWYVLFLTWYEFETCWQWFYHLDYENFAKNVFGSVNCTLLLYQIYYVQLNVLVMLRTRFRVNPKTATGLEPRTT